MSHTMTTTKLEAALTYASWGWHVLPVMVNEKVPATAMVDGGEGRGSGEEGEEGEGAHGCS